MDGDLRRNAGLLPGDGDLAVVDVLRSYAGDLAAACAGMRSDRESQLRLAADGMHCFELRDLFQLPTRSLLALGLHWLDAARHVVFGMLQPAAQRLEMVARCMRLERVEIGVEEIP